MLRWLALLPLNLWGVDMAVIGYVEDTDFTAWAAARGITLTGTASDLLTRSLDFVELQQYKGTRTDATQALSWPRTGVYIDGTRQYDTVVPAMVKELQMRVAADMDAGFDPLKVKAQQVKSKRVEGAVSIEYMDGSYAPDRSSQVSMLLAKLTAAGGGNQFSVVRG